MRLLLSALVGLAVAAGLSACGTGGKVSSSANAQTGKAIFQQKCAGCHALEAAGSTANIGPNLDDAFAEARANGFEESAIANIVHDQIRFPGQFSTAQNNPNYLKANMPANLVRGQDAEDVAAFVAANAGVSGFSVSKAISGTNGQSIFKSQCASCHTLKDAGATGTVGPNLDQLKPPFPIVQNQVIHGGAVMPAFKGKLTDAQIQAVAKYVSSVAGK
ncbi:MAG TPA: c-type cytochrome [Gaiellaceae bacterium]|nr:c-type cytochrome [Gaiellaceae bacterium]